jgi:murein DD-endopeptidase MepM/ murein hydrolase activator NlpD
MHWRSDHHPGHRREVRQRVQLGAPSDSEHRAAVQKERHVAAELRPIKKLRVKERYVTPPPEVRERIKWEAELLESIYGMVTSRWLGDGAFVLPNSGEMVPNFGERRIYNNVPRSAHAGVDIQAASGSAVRAANAGRVVLARDLYFSGKTVILDHGLAKRDSEWMGQIYRFLGLSVGVNMCPDRNCNFNCVYCCQASDSCNLPHSLQQNIGNVGEKGAYQKY